jgi:hypothetical protein
MVCLLVIQARGSVSCYSWRCVFGADWFVKKEDMRVQHSPDHTTQWWRGPGCELWCLVCVVRDLEVERVLRDQDFLDFPASWGR